MEGEKAFNIYKNYLSHDFVFSFDKYKYDFTKIVGY